jgi:hypothetical protein
MRYPQVRVIIADWLGKGVPWAGIKQLHLARRSGVSRDTIYRILRCTTDAEDETLRKLSTALAWPLPELSTTMQKPLQRQDGSETCEGPGTPDADSPPQTGDIVRAEIADHMRLGETPPWSKILEWVERVEQRPPAGGRPAICPADTASMDQARTGPSHEPRLWARWPPGLAWKQPGLPTDWVRVLDQHPEGSQALSG